MAHHARKTAIRELREELEIGHQDAARLLAEPDPDRRDALYSVLLEFVDITTYAQAVDFLDNPPVSFQVMCERCGWTFGMICPECDPGCGCSTGCTGWRHEEMRAMYGEPDDEDDRSHCRDCGAGSSGNPYEECTCYYDDEDEAA